MERKDIIAIAEGLRMIEEGAGSVRVESADGTLAADFLDATLDGDFVMLSGRATAEGTGFSASADEIEVREDGWILRGNVSVDAELSKLGGERGS